MMVDIVKEAVDFKGRVVQHVHMLLVSQAKRYFRESQVPFKEINLEGTRRQRGTASARPGRRGAGDKIGNRWIVGFDKERIEKELGIG
jgi:hypothetical protein